MYNVRCPFSMVRYIVSGFRSVWIRCIIAPIFPVATSLLMCSLHVVARIKKWIGMMVGCATNKTSVENVIGLVQCSWKQCLILLQEIQCPVGHTPTYLVYNSVNA